MRLPSVLVLVIVGAFKGDNRRYEEFRGDNRDMRKLIVEAGVNNQSQD